MKKFTKKQAKELDKILDKLYYSKQDISILGEKSSVNERYELANRLVEDGYVEQTGNRGIILQYAITPKGRSFCRAGGYQQPFRDKWRTDAEKWIDRITGFISGAMAAWILSHWI
jgi:hypothetical protein